MKMKYLFLWIFLFLLNGLTALPDEPPGPVPCHAAFTYTPGAANNLRIEFHDGSAGLIEEWNWNFGDGTGSSGQNPEHTYSNYGTYAVCLTISNNDSLNLCYDTYCDTLTILPPGQGCIAFFTFSLDSSASEPNTFRYFDQSEGDPQNWLWDFGDGHHSLDKNPVHRYVSQGTYTVCLTISGSDTNGVLCSDSTCKAVKTADYFHLGGHLFAGNFPINNPAATGDTGIATLFRVNNQGLFKSDTNRFVYLGYYTFPSILPGKYIVMARLTPGSVNYPNYKPTYYPDAETAGEAAIIKITDSGFFHADIHMLKSNTGIRANSAGGLLFGDLYPVPASDIMNLKVNSDAGGEMHTEIRNSLGQIFSQQSFTIFAGSNELKLNTSGLSAGIYLLIIRDKQGSFVKSFRFIKN